MTTILSEKTVAGQIDAGDVNMIHGWLQLADRAQPLILHLTGNPRNALRGSQIYFQVKSFLDWSTKTERLTRQRDGESTLASHQIGPLFDFQILDANGEVPDDIRDSPLEAQVKLEWSSQDGLVLIELEQALIRVNQQWHGPTSLPPRCLGGVRTPFETDPSASVEDANRHNDPAATEMMDQLIGEKVQDHFDLVDQMIDGRRDVPLESLLNPPLRPAATQTLDDITVQRELRLLLARIAEFGIGLEMCEHFTERQAYQLLVDEILKQKVFPRLRETGFVQQFTTCEYCLVCRTEAEGQLISIP